MRDEKGRFVKGNIAYWKGKKFPDWYKKKLSEVHKKLVKEGAFIPSRKGMEPWDKGKERLDMRGSKHWWWKGGKTEKLKYAYRFSLEYKIWRRGVFERDNYTCVDCGAKSIKGKKVYLEADHEKPQSLFPELRYDINNGKTRCKDCHRKTKTYGRKVSDMKREDFE